MLIQIGLRDGTPIPLANIFNGDLFDSPAAIAASDAIAATFLAQFRTARATFAETPKAPSPSARSLRSFIFRSETRRQKTSMPPSDMFSASPMPSSEQNGPDQADTQETYRRAREGLISYMHGRGRYNFTWEMMLVLDGDCGRVVALWAALCDVERHFGGNPAHMHTKQSRQ